MMSAARAEERPPAPSPQKWGPAAWALLHHVAMAYPFQPDEADRRRFEAFFTALMDILPCAACRARAAASKAGGVPFDAMGGKVQLVWFVKCLHDTVNHDLGKAPYVWCD